MTRINIPPAALEASAALIYAADHSEQRFADASELTRRIYLEVARAAFEAMVAAWPMMHIHEWQRPSLGGMSGTDLILPLPQEGGDE